MAAQQWRAKIEEEGKVKAVAAKAAAAARHEQMLIEARSKLTSPKQIEQEIREELRAQYEATIEEKDKLLLEQSGKITQMLDVVSRSEVALQQSDEFIVRREREIAQATRRAEEAEQHATEAERRAEEAEQHATEAERNSVEETRRAQEELAAAKKELAAAQTARTSAEKQHEVLKRRKAQLLENAHKLALKVGQLKGEIAQLKHDFQAKLRQFEETADEATRLLAERDVTIRQLGMTSKSDRSKVINLERQLGKIGKELNMKKKSNVILKVLLGAGAIIYGKHARSNPYMGEGVVPYVGNFTHVPGEVPYQHSSLEISDLPYMGEGVVPYVGNSTHVPGKGEVPYQHSSFEISDSSYMGEGVVPYVGNSTHVPGKGEVPEISDSSYMGEGVVPYVGNSTHVPGKGEVPEISDSPYMGEGVVPYVGNSTHVPGKGEVPEISDSPYMGKGVVPYVGNPTHVPGKGEVPEISDSPYMGKGVVPYVGNPTRSSVPAYPHTNYTLISVPANFSDKPTHKLSTHPYGIGEKYSEEDIRKTSYLVDPFRNPQTGKINRTALGESLRSRNTTRSAHVGRAVHAGPKPEQKALAASLTTSADVGRAVHAGPNPPEQDSSMFNHSMSLFNRLREDLKATPSKIVPSEAKAAEAPKPPEQLTAMFAKFDSRNPSKYILVKGRGDRNNEFFEKNTVGSTKYDTNYVAIYPGGNGRKRHHVTMPRNPRTRPNPSIIEYEKKGWMDTKEVQRWDLDYADVVSPPSTLVYKGNVFKLTDMHPHTLTYENSGETILFQVDGDYKFRYKGAGDTQYKIIPATMSGGSRRRRTRRNRRTRRRRTRSV